MDRRFPAGKFPASGSAAVETVEITEGDIAARTKVGSAVSPLYAIGVFYKKTLFSTLAAAV